MLRFVLLLGLLGLPAAAGAAQDTFTSGARPVALVELFTSEGCSSCPPAEQWLAARRSDPTLWQAFVPVSWHVDYWNGLGWRDAYSRPEFTARQYAYAAAWHDGSVYTPCFVRNGREWHPGNPADGNAASPGVLTIRYDGRVARGSFAGASGAWELHVVLLGGEIRSRVTAGENAGSTLAHEFVALAAASGPLDRDLALPRQTLSGVSRYALAAWVTRRGSPDPVQATGGWLAAN
ncbi:MAG TPA: DUF1223 domain-containing protein [Opitutaceae bacterium]|nr:DUF1223 domain-containing protein [Opitutaceae bacterium]